MKFLITYLTLLLTVIPLKAEESFKVTRYGNADGLSDWVVSAILQDTAGILWISTWDGLERYDGYNFVRVPDRLEDGSYLMERQIRMMYYGKDYGIWCSMADERIYRFDTDSYLWRTGTMEEWDSMATDAPRSLGHLDQKIKEQLCDIGFPNTSRAGTDRQGNIWIPSKDGVTKVSIPLYLAKELFPNKNLSARASMIDREGRLWLATRDDESIRIYGADRKLQGYLGADGQIHPNRSSFGAMAYSLLQDKDGCIWVGTRLKGLYRLRHDSDGHWTIKRINIGSENIFDLAQDKTGGIWVATRDSGLAYLPHPNEDSPRVINSFKGYPSSCKFVRRLLVTESGLLLAATNEGLLVICPKKGENEQTDFVLHRPDGNRLLSLNGSMVSDFVENSKEGCCYISTTGGIDLINIESLTDTLATFTHLVRMNDAPISMAMTDEYLVVVMGDCVNIFDMDGQEMACLAPSFWAEQCFFLEMKPLRLPDGYWIFGHKQGAFFSHESDWAQSPHPPKVIFTALHLENGKPDISIATRDTLFLSPERRNFSISYAALDYSSNQYIRYRTRLDDANWTNVDTDRSLTFFDFPAGEHRLQVCSTDAYGRQADNARTLIIIAEPKFMETPWAALLLVFLLAAGAAGVTYTMMYIHNLRRKQQETLDAYLALLRRDEQIVLKTGEQGPDADKVFMQRVIDFVEKNLADPEVTNADMARAACTSEPNLYKKMQALLGVSPNSFLQEARLMRASSLLTMACSGSSVTQIASECGFKDPKYFSKCFKKKFGKSPSEYRQIHCIK